MEKERVETLQRIYLSLQGLRYPKQMPQSSLPESWSSCRRQIMTKYVS